MKKKKTKKEKETFRLVFGCDAMYWFCRLTRNETHSIVWICLGRNKTQLLSLMARRCNCVWTIFKHSSSNWPVRLPLSFAVDAARHKKQIWCVLCESGPQSRLRDPCVSSVPLSVMVATTYRWFKRWVEWGFLFCLLFQTQFVMLCCQNRI